jgi:hypothetical protein
MLTDVLRTVLGHAGYAGDTLERLVKQVGAVRTDGKPGAIRFQAQDGELQIVVTQSGREWRTTCPLLLH